MAEDVGFEPTQAFTLLTVFETAPFNRLGNPPDLFNYISKARGLSNAAVIVGLSSSPVRCYDVVNRSVTS